jgi:hypothetical protein
MLALPVVIGIASIGLRVGVETGSSAVGALAGLAVAGLLAGLIGYRTRKAAAGFETFERSGTLSIDAGLDFACLPGRWPTLARETLNPAGAYRVPSLPVVLSIHDRALVLEKKEGWGAGRAPLRVRVPLSAIADVDVGRAERVLAGTSLTVGLTSGEALRLDTSLPPRLADSLAQRLKSEASAAEPAPFDHLDVEAALPPLRTSGTRSWVMLMATFIPFAAAMIGIATAPFAGAAALLALFYTLWLQMRRPPTMHRRVAAAVSGVAVAFLVDALIKQEPVRLGGALVSAAVAAALMRFPTPTYEDASPGGDPPTV